MPAEETTAPPLSVGRRLLYGALTALVFAAALEALLVALDVADPLQRLSITRGFSASARYLVPVPDKPGTLRTQMFSGESPEVEVPPKGAALRVLLLGESNTEGFPEEYIEQRLDEALPDPGCEVFNLGRHGYGSERVRILLTQALELQPDVVLLYLGHNEFVEQGFALEVAQRLSTGALREAVDQLGRLRTMQVAVDAVDSLRNEPARRPEAQQGARADIFRDLTYDRTVLFYKVYRDNLSAMIELLRQAGVRVLLSTIVSNDFDPPTVSTYPPTLPDTARADMFRLRGQALGAVPERFRTGFIQTREDERVIRLRPTDWGETLPAPELAERRARAAPPPSPPALRTLGGAFAGPPLWREPTDWSPQVVTLLASYAQIVERRLTDEERQSLQVAASRFDACLALCPEHPLTLYELGLVRYLLGDDAGAATLLHAAAAWDRAPTHGNDVVNGVIRELCAARAADPGFRAVDAEAAVRADSPGGLVGYEIMMDNCHLHPKARYPLVDLFVPGLVELGRQALDARR